MPNETPCPWERAAEETESCPFARAIKDLADLLSANVRHNDPQGCEREEGILKTRFLRVLSKSLSYS